MTDGYPRTGWNHPTAKYRTERMTQIVFGRADGMTYRQIGELIGVSTERVRQIYERFAREDRFAASRFEQWMEDPQSCGYFGTQTGASQLAKLARIASAITEAA